jgi:subtilisin family serine protease
MGKAGMFLVIMVLLVGLVPAAAAAQPGSGEGEFVVVYAEGASLDAAHAAIKAIGGTIVKENAAVGVATIKTSNQNFAAEVGRQSALSGAARSKPIGGMPRLVRPNRDDIERLDQERQASKGQVSAAVRNRRGPEPLADLQWDMQMINATASGSYRAQRGNKRVLVGIIDSGIDGSHPDLAPNFDRDLSRTFTTDIPLIDGPCEEEPDQSCDDAVDADDNGHGSHVAGTVAAALNGLGIAGVAPNVTLVNLRAGQDSGYVFLQPVVDALVYAGDTGIDVVNMSFYIDPWQYNCTNNPADTPEEQQEQRTIIEATSRALKYARRHGVTLVGSAGNDHMNLDNRQVDDSSPDYPPGSERVRTIDNSCLDMPTEGPGVISVSAIGPSFTKADYSNYGSDEIELAAPGGYFRDFFGTDQFQSVENLVLSTYPKELAIANGDLNPDGTPNTPFVVRDCKGDTCAYYQYLQGTSMASPHVVGVAALIISEFGKKDQKHPGLAMEPSEVRSILRRSAAEHD